LDGVPGQELSPGTPSNRRHSFTERALSAGYALGSTVEDLQADALDPAVPTSAVLLKALVVASKLDLASFEAWLRQELDGYAGSEDSVPEYRRARGELRVWNPYYGWRPILYDDGELEETLCHQYICLPIAEIEQLHRQISRCEGGALHVDLNPEQQQSIAESLDQDLSTAVTTFIPQESPRRILDVVRGTIVNWALDLEARGIGGQNLNFSAQERAAAADTGSASFYFLGAGARSAGAAVQPPPSRILYSVIDLGNAATIVAAVRQALEWVRLPDPSRHELCTDLDTLDVQLGSRHPKRRIVHASLYSARRILESALSENADRPLPELIAQIESALGS
jgi:hypothetical protein